MLKTPDAAAIVQAGRAYLQVGNNEIYELFQSAWSGAAYETGQTIEEKEDDRVYLVNALGQGELLNRDLSGPIKDNQIKETQLDVLVGHMQEVYQQLDAVAVKKTWLPSLARQIVSPYLEERKDTRIFTQLDLKVGIGMVDIPEEQRQQEYEVDFLKNGHFLYMASSGYGKTMLLTSIILGLCVKNSVNHLNCYILDFGNNALISLKPLPQVADYMGVDDEEKIRKFQKLIMDELALRKKKLAQAMVQNFMLYNETQEEKMKAIVIVVDNYDVVSELGDQMVTFIQKAARDGAGLGIYFVVTMTRENVMRSATKANFKEKAAGYNFEKAEINSFMGRSHIELPEAIKGRALVKLENLNLMQIYTPVAFEQEVEYVQKLKELIAGICAASTEEKAKGIPMLPDAVLYERLPEYPGYENKPELIPMGLDTDSLNIVYLDVKKQPGLIIGEAGMGRTNQLKSALRHIGEHKVYLFDADKGELGKWQEKENVIYSLRAKEDAAAIEQLHREVKERKEAFEEARIDDVTLKISDFVSQLVPIYIVIDVVQELYERMAEAKLEEYLATIAEAVQVGFYLIATSNAGTFRDQRNKLLMLLKEAKEGVIVGNVKQQSIFSLPGIREANHRPDMGYYVQMTRSGKVKYIENEAE